MTKNQRRKAQQTELVSFKARVVEVEAYKSVVEGKVLYHAVLDSLEGESQRQAQFFGLSENIFEAGCVHVVTFSRAVAKSRGKVVKKSKNELAAQRAEEIAKLEKMIQ